ncbi:MAG TPA: ribonuclease HI family protein [Candidatus Paceibacterota bacterium]|nr:ribonuclease HI family protein [Candidatus Paceibacterota bacterium]
MQKITIHTDGGARGNPGPAGIGAVVTDERGTVIREVSKYIGEQTNNFAEYEALIVVLNELKKMFGEKLREMQLEVKMDSELVVRQLSGIYKVKEPTLKEQFAKVAKIRLEDAPNMTFTHVFREANAHADKLVNKAIDASLK